LALPWKLLRVSLERRGGQQTTFCLMGRCAQRYTTRRYFFLTPFQAVRFTSKLSWLYCEIGLVKTVKYVPSRLYSRVLQAQTIDGRFFRVAACLCSPQTFFTALRQRQRLWCERSCARACITRQRQCGSARAAGSLEAAHQARPRRAGGRAGPGLQRGRGGCNGKQQFTKATKISLLPL
jgi:hypothetical protein